LTAPQTAKLVKPKGENNLTSSDIEVPLKFHLCLEKVNPLLERDRAIPRGLVEYEVTHLRRETTESQPVAMVDACAAIVALLSSPQRTKLRKHTNAVQEIQFSKKSILLIPHSYLTKLNHQKGAKKLTTILKTLNHHAIEYPSTKLSNETFSVYGRCN
jgi:hypothetical protein